MAPAKCRRVAGPATSQATQPRLSFRNSKAGTAPGNKVTKPGATSTAKAAKKESAIEHGDVSVKTADITPEDLTPPQTDLIDEKPASNVAAEAPTRDHPRLTTARKLPASQIKAYWAAKEAARRAPRVHQASLSMHEKILREFDMQSRFGPCVGVSRAGRWWRAEGLGLKPPVEVLAVLVKEDVEGVDGKGPDLAVGRVGSGVSVVEELMEGGGRNP